MTIAPHAVCYGVVGDVAGLDGRLRRHAVLARGVNTLWLAVPASPVTTRPPHNASLRYRAA